MGSANNIALYLVPEVEERLSLVWMYRLALQIQSAITIGI